MKYYRLIPYIIIIFLLCQTAIVNEPIYAGNPDNIKIRQMSLKKSDQLFKELAIDLLNGKSRFVSLDSMVKILKDYKIVEFCSKDIEPARDIIIKEVAFRMLKQHYLPRYGDKIKVYKLEREFLTETGIPRTETNGFETNIRLPLEIATARESNELKTIYWANLVMQISNVIEKLWLNRISYAGLSGDISNKEAVLEAASILRRGFIQGQGMVEEEALKNGIAAQAAQKLESWLKEGLISKEDLPFMCEVIIQYMILSTSDNLQDIAADIKNLKSINDLREAFYQKIKTTTDNLRSNNPTDYGAFAMFQSILNELSTRFPRSADISTDGSPNINPQESRHSA